MLITPSAYTLAAMAVRNTATPAQREATAITTSPTPWKYTEGQMHTALTVMRSEYARMRDIAAQLQLVIDRLTPVDHVAVAIPTTMQSAICVGPRNRVEVRTVDRYAGVVDGWHPLEWVSDVIIEESHPLYRVALEECAAAVDMRLWSFTENGRSVVARDDLTEEVRNASGLYRGYELGLIAPRNPLGSIQRRVDNFTDSMRIISQRFDAAAASIEQARRDAIRARFRANFSASLREQNPGGQDTQTPTFPATADALFTPEQIAALSLRPSDEISTLERFANLTESLRAVRFGEWVNRRKATITPADVSRFAALIPNTEDNAASMRDWGIEIEHVDCGGVYAPREWERKDDCSLRSYSGSDSCECECSGEVQAYINGDYHNVDCGEYGYYCDVCNGDHECDENDDDRDTGEFVSPILNSVFSSGLESLTDDLDGRGVNDSAGVHVHVNAPDFRENAKLQGAAVYAWALIDPIIEPLFQRGTREYCKAHYASEVRMAARATKRGVLANGGHLPSVTIDRYRGLNLVSLRSHGTLEFRAMGAVYEFDYLTRWAAFCRAFVESIATNPDVSRFQSARTLSDVLAAVNLTEFVSAN